MLTIKGKAVRKERAKIPAPKDGVHRNGSDGYLKGSHCMYINGVFTPHGQVGFYWRIDEDNGLKVYYSIKHGYSASKKWIAEARSRQKILAKKGICVNPGRILKVYIDIDYKGKVHKKKTVYALETEHIHYPPEEWEKYTNGYPYDFGCYDHPDHSPEGYKRAKKRVDTILRKLKMKKMKYVGDSYKLGDMLFCTKRNKWFLCDVG